MKQRHTEESLEYTNDQQNTGDHKRTGMPEKGSADRICGTRVAVENVERVP